MLDRPREQELLQVLPLRAAHGAPAQPDHGLERLGVGDPDDGADAVVDISNLLILTGNLNDGSAGLWAIKELGG